jgi:TPR repeat protein
MDSPRKFINLNTPIINLIKFLTVATSFILAAPIFADTNQESACYSKYNAGDYDSALSICTKAAEQGNASAQYNLGLMFNSGQGVPQDYKQALYWLTKAAEQGIARAQYNLGLAFDNGQGVPQDYKQAIYWFTKAAEQGHAIAQYSLGIMLYNGVGKPKDNVMAYVWWNIAAAQGHEDAKETRGLIEEEMTPNQIAEAQKLSKEYYAKYVK